MNAKRYSMQDILPHQGHMLLLDELVSCDDETITTAVTIRADSVLCEGQLGVPAWVGMEYMAQTACAYSGVSEAKAGLPPSISLLLGTRSYQATAPVFPLGARLLVTAKLLVRDDDDLVVFDCRIHHGELELARGDIKAIRPKNIQALIEAQLHG